MRHRYTYQCVTCGVEYESFYRSPDKRRCLEHAIMRSTLLQQLQHRPDYVSRLKRLQAEFLPEGYR